MPLPNPVIVIPGITAVYLRDLYPLPPESIYEVMEWSKDYGRAAVHPDSFSFPRLLEAKEPAQVVPDQIYEIAYRELIEELRHNLRDAEEFPVPVYPFGYDWRQPLSVIEADLERFIEDVVRRTSLMKHYFDDGYDDVARRKVNLVGHSMGGLIIAGYVQSRPGAPVDRRNRVEKIVTLASPFRGSIEAIAKIVTGNANLGTEPPSSREREAARATPSVYHLLPSFTNGIDIPATLPQTLFDRAVWQRSVVGTLAEYVRKYGRQPGNAQAQGDALFDQLLDVAGQHRARLEGLDLRQAGFDPDNWLCVVGVDTKTRVHIAIDAQGQSGPEFRFDPNVDLLNDWPNSRITGDGTVPLEGAIPAFLPENALVCVTPDDFDFWEIQDRGLAQAAGLHGILPNMDMLHRMIVRYFKPDARGDAWGRPLPGVAAPNWRPPLPITLKS